LGIGEVLGVQCPSEAFPVAVQDEKEFIAAKGSVAVGESKATALLFSYGIGELGEAPVLLVLRTTVTGRQPPATQPRGRNVI
jgi:hypothetical protein